MTLQRQATHLCAWFVLCVHVCMCMVYGVCARVYVYGVCVQSSETNFAYVLNLGDFRVKAEP